MRRTLLMLSISAIFFYVNAQQTFTIVADGFTFSPSTLTVNLGDKVQFNSGSGHPVLQVSESTWNSNGTTPLSEGFSFSSGTGEYEANTAGTFYYICTFHVDGGMKGRIIVNATTNLETTVSKSNFSIFPSYATDFVNILNTGNLPIRKISIIDLSGRIILSLDEFISSEEEIRIDINKLKKGIYFIYLESGNLKISRKFMKL